MSDIIDYGAEVARSSYANVVIGMGGIRCLSIAKAIAMLANNRGDISDYFSGLAPANTSIPYIEIPTTPRNPFMFTDEYWVVNAKNRNSSILIAKENTTRYVLFDPMLTTTLPRRFTATTTIHALSNAIEGYISTKSNFLSDTLFLRGIALINENLNEAVDYLLVAAFRHLGESRFKREGIKESIPPNDKEVQALKAVKQFSK